MNTNFNPLQFIELLKRSNEPQQLMMNLLQEKMGNNPLFVNLMQLAQQGRGADIEGIARNMMKEKGLDFDKEFNSFRQQFGL